MGAFVTPPNPVPPPATGAGPSHPRRPMPAGYGMPPGPHPYTGPSRTARRHRVWYADAGLGAIAGALVMLAVFHVTVWSVWGSPPGLLMWVGFPILLPATAPLTFVLLCCGPASVAVMAAGFRLMAMRPADPSSLRVPDDPDGASRRLPVEGVWLTAALLLAIGEALLVLGPPVVVLGEPVGHAGYVGAGIMLALLSAALIPLAVQARKHPLDRRAWPAVMMFTGMAVGLTLLSASCSFVFGRSADVVGPPSPDGSRVVRVMRNVPVTETVDLSGSNNITHYGVYAVARPGIITVPAMPDGSGPAELRTEHDPTGTGWVPTLDPALDRKERVSWEGNGSALITVRYVMNPERIREYGTRTIRVDADGRASDEHALSPNGAMQRLIEKEERIWRIPRN